MKYLPSASECDNNTIKHVSVIWVKIHGWKAFRNSVIFLIIVNEICVIWLRCSLRPGTFLIFSSTLAAPK